jgi:hypothetical protein
MSGSGNHYSFSFLSNTTPGNTVDLGISTILTSTAGDNVQASTSWVFTTTNIWTGNDIGGTGSPVTTTRAVYSIQTPSRFEYVTTKTGGETISHYFFDDWPSGFSLAIRVGDDQVDFPNSNATAFGTFAVVPAGYVGHIPTSTTSSFLVSKLIYTTMQTWLECEYTRLADYFEFTTSEIAYTTIVELPYFDENDDLSWFVFYYSNTVTIGNGTPDYGVTVGGTWPTVNTFHTYTEIDYEDYEVSRTIIIDSNGGAIWCFPTFTKTTVVFNSDCVSQPIPFDEYATLAPLTFSTQSSSSSSLQLYYLGDFLPHAFAWGPRYPGWWGSYNAYGVNNTSAAVSRNSEREKNLWLQRYLYHPGKFYYQDWDGYGSTNLVYRATTTELSTNASEYTSTAVHAQFDNFINGSYFSLNQAWYYPAWNSFLLPEYINVADFLNSQSSNYPAGIKAIGTMETPVSMLMNNVRSGYTCTFLRTADLPFIRIWESYANGTNSIISSFAVGGMGGDWGFSTACPLAINVGFISPSAMELQFSTGYQQVDVSNQNPDNLQFYPAYSQNGAKITFDIPITTHITQGTVVTTGYTISHATVSITDSYESSTYSFSSVGNADGILDGTYTFAGLIGFTSYETHDTRTISSSAWSYFANTATFTSPTATTQRVAIGSLISAIGQCYLRAN